MSNSRSAPPAEFAGSIPAQCTAEQRLVMSMLAAPSARFRWGDPHALAANVSWEKYLEAADVKIQPYLHWASLQAPFDSIIPGFVRNELATTRFSTRIRNLRWAAELRQMLAGFHEDHIAILLVKGSALQRIVYPDPSTRPMADVDLVVRREDIQRVERTMVRLGFLARTSAEQHTPQPGMEVFDETCFYKRVGDSMLLVEIHTRLEMHAAGLADTPSSMWVHRVEIPSTDGMLVPTLDPHTTLRHLCLHLAKHDFDFGLVWLLDIRLFLEHFGNSIQWDAFLRACDPQTLREVAFTLMLAADWLGAEVPPNASLAFTPEQKKHAVALAWGQMTDQVRTRKPPNAFLLALSANPRRIGDYLQAHFRSWTAPVPGDKTHPLALMGKRIWSDLRIFQSAFLMGGFKPSNIRTAMRSDRRAVQLRAMLKDHPVKR